MHKCRLCFDLFFAFFDIFLKLKNRLKIAF